jgi:hypothetical protein
MILCSTHHYFSFNLCYLREAKKPLAPKRQAYKY